MCFLEISFRVLRISNKMMSSDNNYYWSVCHKISHIFMSQHVTWFITSSSNLFTDSRFWLNNQFSFWHACHSFSSSLSLLHGMKSTFAQWKWIDLMHELLIYIYFLIFLNEYPKKKHRAEKKAQFKMETNNNKYMSNRQ